MFRLCALITSLILEVTCSFAYAQEKEPLVLSFGVVPQQSASVLAKKWIPILALVEKDTGLKISFKTAPNIETFEKRTVAGEYDIAYMNPYHYTVFSQKPGYKAFAKQKNKSITGIIVVKKDSAIMSLKELEGQRIAFPSPAAFAASILTRAEFAKNGVNIEPVYVSSHDSVYQNIQRGFFSAGGGIQRTLNTVGKETSDELRILTKTAKYTPHAFAAHPRLSDETLNKVKLSFINLASSEVGKEALEKIAFKQGIEAAHDSSWDDVRALNIDLLKHLLDP